MLSFVIRYGIWVSLLFFLLFFEGISPFIIFNEWQTQLTIQITAWWIQFFHLPVLLQGDTLILEHGFNLQILHSCNGFTPFLLYLAAILAYPTDIKSKLLWALLGYIAIIVINTLRMYAITIVVMDSPDLFHLAHDWIGRYGVSFLTVALFYGFTCLVSVNKK